MTYILLCREKFAKDKLGLSWVILLEKAKEFAKLELEGDAAESLSASPGWCLNVLRRNGLKGASLHGKGMKMDEEAATAAMREFRDEVRELTEKKNIPSERTFNADQTGLFHQKLPNRIYCRQEEKRTIRGVKQMKAKERNTLMVCISAVGEKLPLSVVGKAMRPQCWDLCGNKPPVSYTNQTNARFDRQVTHWWIWEVVFAWYKQRHGELPCLLILDNCPAHEGIGKICPSAVCIKFLPRNLTSRFQLMDQGITHCLKVGYTTNLLRSLLSVYDDDTVTKAAPDAGKRQRRRCKGMAHGHKPHILDAMTIIKGIWNGEKYARPEHSTQLDKGELSDAADPARVGSPHKPNHHGACRVGPSKRPLLCHADLLHCGSQHHSSRTWCRRHQ